MIRLMALLLASLMLPNLHQEGLPPLTDPDAYAIYGAILPNEWPTRIAKAKRLVIATMNSRLSDSTRPEREPLCMSHTTVGTSAVKASID